MKRIAYLGLFFLMAANVQAAEYNASLFGCKSDGVTNNTSSIQYAIDFISGKGGGTLHFYVGRYLTGSFELKSNVTIELHEGAVILASPNVYDYLNYSGSRALIYANGQSNIKIQGKGVIQGQVPLFTANMENLTSKGIVRKDSQHLLPDLIRIENSEQVTVDGIMLLNGLENVQSYIGCRQLSLSNQIIKSNAYGSSTGIFLSACSAVELRSLYVDASGKPLREEGKNEIRLQENCVTPNGKKL
ncbi:hypothetical protein GCM10011386_05730 [Parapedobacter defluvii]|uniref:Uncharacterized protein n=1 Tax=Parapedobacter defluvii TaxID=2045106 RepID=A0ABQ1L119_9SPHI|nr:glycosyl hydrolase family 28 protein [Parapedobacter defluvii]GGC16760.1 hypothetical protein GCM10011386_05730 [Parapedobacter defluvii]